MTNIALNVKPLPVSQAFQGRWFKTSLYKNFETEVYHLLPKVSIKGKVEINYEFHLKFAATTDYDNLIKPLQDILVMKGIIEDDRFIYKATIEKFKAKGNFIIIKIKEYEDRASEDRGVKGSGL